MLQSDESIKDVSATHKVWVKEGNVFRAVAVQTGITNGTLTEITSGLKEGQKIITEFVMSPSEEANAQQDNNPFMPKPRNNQKKKSGDSTNNASKN